MKILIVEDEQICADLAVYAIKIQAESKQEQIVIEVARTFGEGIEIARTLDPSSDAVLLDLVLPDCKDDDGNDLPPVKVFEVWRRTYPALCVIVCSGWLDEEVSMAAAKDGCRVMPKINIDGSSFAATLLSDIHAAIEKFHTRQNLSGEIKEFKNARQANGT